MSTEIHTLHSWFPFTKTPLICSAPMRTVSGPELAVAASMAGGLGFIGAGYTLENLTDTLSRCSSLLTKAGAPPSELLPIGVGFLPWNCDISDAIGPMEKYPPCAVWLFGTASNEQLTQWVHGIKKHLPKTKIFVQVGSAKEAEAALLIEGNGVDALVTQGVADSGGHGLVQGASVMTLLPEVIDSIAELKIERRILRERILPVLAAGGIMDGRAVAASLVLGAHGAVIGTRLIASDESEAHSNFKSFLISAKDGGQNTIRTRLYDNLRGTGNWPQQYNGRAVMNASFYDKENGVDEDTNRKRYEEAAEKNDYERATAFAGMSIYSDNALHTPPLEYLVLMTILSKTIGTGVGLIKDIQPARKIIEDAQERALEILSSFSKQ